MTEIGEVRPSDRGAVIYVGVENSTAKVRLATRRPSRTIYVDPTDLAWDCQRHVAFLRDAETHLKDGWDEAWMLRSQYAGWMLQGGRTQPAVLARCRRFLERLAEIRLRGLDGPWATVTADGIRLDGSHRAAIAVILELESVSVAEVPYMSDDERWRREAVAYRAKRIREQVAYKGMQ